MSEKTTKFLLVENKMFNVNQFENKITILQNLNTHLIQSDQTKETQEVKMIIKPHHN